MLTVPEYRPHQLKGAIQERGLTLWQLRAMLGGVPSEGKLSRLLNGIEAMPEGIEDALQRIVKDVDAHRVEPERAA